MPHQVAAERDGHVLAATRRGRPARAGCCWCTASSAQSCTDTTVRLAPSPTTTSMLSASTADPSKRRARRWRCCAPRRRARGARRRRRSSDAAVMPDDRPARRTTASAGTVTHGDVGGGGPGPRRDAVGGHVAARPARRVVGPGPARPRRPRRPRTSTLVADAPARRGVLVQAAQPLERREAPDLLAPGRHRVRGHVERALGCRWEAILSVVSTASATAGSRQHVSVSSVHTVRPACWAAGVAVEPGCGSVRWPPARRRRADPQRAAGRGRRATASARSADGVSRPRLPSAARSAG